METKRYEFLLEALQPIAHHSETFGNVSVAMRRKVRQLDGSFCQVPIITADSMRHGLREAGAYAFLDAAGLLETGELSEAALRLLFVGGMVTGRGNAGAIKLDNYRRMVELCPSLGLLGGCADNRIMPGRLEVTDATLVCSEHARFIPQWIGDWMDTNKAPVDTCRTHIEEVQRVRMDPTLDPGKRKLLSDGEHAKAAARLEASEKAHGDDDGIARAETKSSMMPRKFERIVQGSLFSWGVTATCYSDLDVDTLHTVLGVFLARPIVGGKRGTGHGELRVVQAQHCTIQRPAERAESMDVSALAGRTGSLFRSHVAERADEIREWLQDVNA